MKPRSGFPLLVLLLLPLAMARGHDGLALDTPNSPSEAWNVILLCHANIEKLLLEKNLAEIPLQCELTVEATRYLRSQLASQPAAADLWNKLQKFEDATTVLAHACQMGGADQIAQAEACYVSTQRAAETGYAPAVVHAIVYSCPMCKGVRDLNPNARCYKCGMKLVPRVIPASSLYNTPGEPSITLTPVLDHPLVVGQASQIKIRFTRKKDGAPLTLDDFLVVHTKPIHLLIIDQSLTDYHHEHPNPTGVPGEYAFSLTPQRPGPYRVFADVVPVLSNVQEYAVCDLPAVAPGKPYVRSEDVSSAEAGGLHFSLDWKAAGLPIRARLPVDAAITVTTPDGNQFHQLEPVMGTFAHIVGFYDDHVTVLHMHPITNDPSSPADRGGPTLNFRFYAPKSGSVRLFVQVQVEGKNVFAPFSLTVAP